MNYRRLSYLFPLAVMGLIFSLSHQSRLPVDMPSFYGADKVCHFLAYGFLAFSLWLSFVLNRHRFVFLPCLMISFFYGVFDEIHQLYVPGRSFEWSDIAADFSGACFTLLLLFYLRNKGYRLRRHYQGQLKSVTKASEPGRVLGM